jgi:hypothetical protein
MPRLSSFIGESVHLPSEKRNKIKREVFPSFRLAIPAFMAENLTEVVRMCKWGFDPLENPVFVAG